MNRPQVRVEESALSVFDPIERQHYRFATDDRTAVSVSAPEVDTDGGDGFPVPVDTVTTFAASEVRFPDCLHAYVISDTTGVDSIYSPATASLPPGTHLLDLGTPLNIYVRVEGRAKITCASRTELTFPDGPTTVTVGIRSYHDRPAVTVPVTRSLDGVAAGLSTLGSALKSTTPDRSFPTLRGYAPELVFDGDEENGVAETVSPDCIDTADTGVTIVVPESLQALYAVSSLAYYLAADVAVATTDSAYRNPGIWADDTRVATFDSNPETVATVANAQLKRNLVLDAVVRQEGRYDTEFDEQEALVDGLSKSPSRLHEMDIAGRLREYQAVPTDTIDATAPHWGTAVSVPDRLSALPVISHLTTALPLLYPAEPHDPVTKPTPESVADILSDGGLDADATTFVSVAGRTARQQVFVPPDEQTVATNATTATLPAMRHSLETTSSETLDVALVVTDPEMAPEGQSVAEIYRSSSDHFTLTVHREATVAALREVLDEDHDLLHYVGHTTDRGFECVDGLLDARTLRPDEVQCASFIANSCESLRQGRALLDKGAAAGAVTVSDVPSQAATAVGTTFARLLDQGFTVGTSLQVASEVTGLHADYLCLGDGSAVLTQASSGTPVIVDAVQADEETDAVGPHGDERPPCGTAETGKTHYHCTIQTHQTTGNGVGSLFLGADPVDEPATLCFGDTSTTLTTDELVEWCGLQSVPVFVDGTLHWSDEIAETDAVRNS